MIDLREILDLEILLVFAKYTVLLTVKMMLMSLITAFYRMKKKAFANPEDAGSLGKGDAAKKFVRTDPDVERLRRCHLNDIENILPFILIGFFYSISGVSLATATLHYRIFFASRIFHTIAYLVPLPQPCRALAWFTGYLVTFSMVYKLLVHVLSIS
ncbi:microsomal glutathione S-transferase 1 [Tiliqua scincoides]|uniref:microsomal glutathione S-transferase 1 n=1 Tax=Tiliqua scincoides TaxID=71010 RepID=UPI0034631DAF